MRLTACTFVMTLTFFAATAQAATITVFSDINIWRDSPLLAGNAQLGLNMLGSSTNVLMSSQTGPVNDADALAALYAAQGGVAFSRSGAALTGGLLAGLDLLVLDIAFDTLSPYDASERSAIAAFLAGGGDVALIAESINQSIIDSFNTLLAEIGSSISYEGPDRAALGSQLADTILNVPLTSGVASFEVAAINNLLGGTPAIQDEDFTAVAFEETSLVPEPSTLALFGIGMAALVAWRRQKTYRELS